MAKQCIACIQGFTWECTNRGNCNAANSGNTTSSAGDAISSIPTHPSTDEMDDRPDEDIEFEDTELVVRTQDDSKLKDQQSTGRKRAAKLYPLAEGAPCEWNKKKNCGGGSRPIVGCFQGTQQARHHGPDKNTLNNEKGNVHRICHTCHNRWHTENDPGYTWGSVYPDHSPVAATDDEIVKNELAWMTRDTKEIKDDN